MVQSHFSSVHYVAMYTYTWHGCKKLVWRAGFGRQPLPKVSRLGRNIVNICWLVKSEGYWWSQYVLFVHIISKLFQWVGGSEWRILVGPIWRLICAPAWVEDRPWAPLPAAGCNTLTRWTHKDTEDVCFQARVEQEQQHKLGFRKSTRRRPIWSWTSWPNWIVYFCHHLFGLALWRRPPLLATCTLAPSTLARTLIENVLLNFSSNSLFNAGANLNDWQKQLKKLVFAVNV